MGNCSGVKLDQAQIVNGNLNEIQAYDQNLNQIQDEHNSEDFNQLIEKLRTMEELAETLVTESNIIVPSIQEFSDKQFKNSPSNYYKQTLFCKEPSVKLLSLNKLPEKLLHNNQESLQADMKLQDVLLRNNSYEQKKSILRSSKYYYEGGETMLNKVYRPVKVYSRFNAADDKEGDGSINSQKKYLEDQSSPQIFKFNNVEEDSENYITEDQIKETESDGNYEGSEEENVKAKEKLIDNLFSDRIRGKQLSVIDDADESAEKSPDYKSLKISPGSKSRQRDNVKIIQRKNSKKIKNFPTFTFQGGTFQGEIANKQRNGIGQQTFMDGTIYMGEWKQDKRQGKGVQIWPDDTLYEGQWEDDCIQGIGKIEYSNRSYYIGEWKQNKFHGKGRFQHFSGSYYEGFWYQDLSHGKGVEVQLFPTYSRYEGIFEMGKKQGKGRLLMSNGSIYKGDFNSGNVHGLGVYHWSNGVSYEGRWENNKMSGNGKMTWPNNISYQGEFKSDQKCGIGFIEYEDGSKYIGEWKTDKQHGKGTFYFKKNNSQIKGIWENGKLTQITSYYAPKNMAITQQLFQNNNFNFNNNMLVPNIPLNMIKVMPSPKNSIEIPENINNSQRSIYSQDNKPSQPKKSKHKLESGQKPNNSGGNKIVLNKAFSLKVPHERR